TGMSLREDGLSPARRSRRTADRPGIDAPRAARIRRSIAAVRTGKGLPATQDRTEVAHSALSRRPAAHENRVGVDPASARLREFQDMSDPGDETGSSAPDGPINGDVPGAAPGRGMAEEPTDPASAVRATEPGTTLGGAKPRDEPRHDPIRETSIW